jgi:hypothetical protein
MSTEELAGTFTLSEFCTINRIGRTYAYNEIKLGRLTAVKAGSKTLILKKEAARWAASLPKLDTRKNQSPTGSERPVAVA